MNAYSTVQNQTGAQPTFTPIIGGILQRASACGQHTASSGGECEECKKKREGTLQRAAINSSPMHDVPPIINQVLHSPGQPLDAATRAFMEPRFGHDFSGVRVHTGQPKHIQTKLAVNHPGDRYEQEADQVAEQIVRMSDASNWELRHQPIADAEIFQAKENSSDTSEVTADLETRIHTMKGGGQPLPEAERSFFEPRFGLDFSQVRLHTDGRAADAARELGARAYTVGADIAFGARQYAPETQEGRRLLAHELAHVVQQRHGASPDIRMSALSDFKDKDDMHDPSKLTDAQIEATDEFKAYMDPKLIWQWQLKVTHQEALLACRLILRQMRDGKTVTWESQARDFVLTARKQLGTLKETEKLVGKLEWVGSQESEFKSPATAESDFARWLLAGGPEPTDTGKMNCWEMILFGAFQGGIVGKDRIQKMYEEAAKKSGLDVPAEIESRLCKGSKLTFDPSDPKSPEPLPGDIVIFDVIAKHAAISLGTKDLQSGEHQVISHWTPPNFSKKVKKTTIEQLLPHAGLTEVKFCTSAW